MGQHMLTPPSVDYVDPRRNLDSSKVDGDSHALSRTLFTANAGGSTTTMVGAAPASGTNAVAVGDSGTILSAAGVRKGNVIVTAVNAGGTTITFAPALAGATVSTDVLRSNNPRAFTDNNSMDSRLLAIGGVYTQKYIDSMTQNDKVYAIRVNDDPTSFLG